MRLKDAKASMLFPLIPPPLKGKLTLASTCDLTDHERMLFAVAINTLAKAIKKAPVPEEHLYINAVITDRDEVTLQVEPAGVMGNELHLVIYPVHRWRAVQFKDLQILAVITEELCHAIWHIVDEEAVMDKVTDVIQENFPSVTFASLYPGAALRRTEQARQSVDPSPSAPPDPDS